MSTIFNFLTNNKYDTWSLKSENNIINIHNRLIPNIFENLLYGFKNVLIFLLLPTSNL